MRDQAERYWAVVPAGGSGTRLGAATPKQYLDLAGQTMIEWSVAALMRADWIEKLLVVVAPTDPRAAVLLRDRSRVEVLARGGATRRDTVLEGLLYLRDSIGAPESDWVMVHDAARPAVSLAALERLRDALAGGDTGGLLAVPVADTVKRERRIASEAGGTVRRSPPVAATVDRSDLWLAQTPQMFRLGRLADALEQFSDVTDEASAIEAAGDPVLLIEGDRMNFKVTTADDLDLMRRVLGG